MIKKMVQVAASLRRSVAFSGVLAVKGGLGPETATGFM